jgi:hypothetical protein
MHFFVMTSTEAQFAPIIIITLMSTQDSNVAQPHKTSSKTEECASLSYHDDNCKSSIVPQRQQAHNHLQRNAMTVAMQPHKHQSKISKHLLSDDDVYKSSIHFRNRHRYYCTQKKGCRHACMGLLQQPLV